MVGVQIRDIALSKKKEKKEIALKDAGTIVSLA